MHIARCLPDRPAGFRWPAHSEWSSDLGLKTKFQKTSGPDAGMLNGRDAWSTKSGGPGAQDDASPSASFRCAPSQSGCQPGAKTGGGGISSADPSGAPARTQSAIRRICSLVQSPLILKFAVPGFGVATAACSGFA